MQNLALGLRSNIAQSCKYFGEIKV